MVAVAQPGPPARRQLSRAGWNVISGTSLPGRPETPTSRASTPTLLRDFEAEGKRLVNTVASFWSQKYIFMIRNGGAKDGMLHYEVVFSRPTDEQPVPVAVVSVCFSFLPAQAGKPPRLFYSFEEGDLRHEWALRADGKGGWQASLGQQIGSLRDRSFETYLNTCIRDKDSVRRRGINIKTNYEVSRILPPPEKEKSETASQVSDSDFGSSSAGSFVCAARSIKDPEKQEMAFAMRDALRAANMFCDKVPPPASLGDLLNNIFDAADEEGLGEMTHYEVVRVLMATLPGFGLDDWDIHQLLSIAQENDEGCIQYAAFVQIAPPRIQSLRKRRKAYKDRGLPGVEIPTEAVKHCFTDELMATHDKLMDILTSRAQEEPDRAIFEQPQGIRIPGGPDPEDRNLVALKRRNVADCLQLVSERLSPQEARMIMQMLPEDENGFLYINDLADQLETIRVGAVLNSVTESNARDLRTALVQYLRPRLDDSGCTKIWLLKHGLLEAEQLNLSRLQIHTILCLADHDPNGDVDVGVWAALCSSVIPHMMNARIFVDTSERLQQEAAEAAKERQNAEFAMMGATRMTGASADEEEEEKEKVVQMDQDGVERTLIQVFSLADDTRKPVPALPPQTIYDLMCNTADAHVAAQVLSCGLGELEVSGLMAEMSLDANGEVPFHDFVRRWVPILFELRNNQLLNAYMKRGAAEHLGLPEPNIEALEAVMPLMPDRMPEDQDTPMVRQDSKIVRRRGSCGSKRMPEQSSLGSVRMQHKNSISSVSGEEMAKKLTTAKGQPEKEIPPGRGYTRRKLFLEQKQGGPRPGSK